MQNVFEERPLRVFPDYEHHPIAPLQTFPGGVGGEAERTAERV